MNYKEALSAFENDTPIECKGVVYRRITSIITKKNKSGRKYIELEMEDVHGNSLTTDLMRNVKAVPDAELPPLPRELSREEIELGLKMIENFGIQKNHAKKTA